MPNSALLLAQGNPVDALVGLVTMAGIVVVPAAIGSWVLWASKGRPSSGVVVAGLAVASAAFLVWLAAFILFCTIPSPDEEIAVEQVESAFPILDTSTWSYSAKNPSKNLWMITVEGYTRAGQPIHEKFRVTPDAVEREQTSAPSGWVMLKQWSTSAPSSQPTSAP
jgi:hypothetical protein